MNDTQPSEGEGLTFFTPLSKIKLHFILLRGVKLWLIYPDTWKRK